jgi:hypothetical protein
MEGQYAGTIGMAGGLPTIDEAGALQGGVGGTGRCDVEVAHDDGREGARGASWLVMTWIDSVRDRAPKWSRWVLQTAQCLPTGDVRDGQPVGYSRPITIPTSAIGHVVSDSKNSCHDR